MNDLVVARYAEDLDWIAEVPAEFRVHIYNKGAPITSRAVIARAARVVERENVGREAETYLTHVEMAERASEGGYTVFTQGDPFEHSPDFIALLRAWEGWGEVQPLSWRWRVKRDIPPAAVLDRERAGFIAGLRVRPELFSLVTWSPLGFYDVGTQWLDETYREVHRLGSGTNIASHFLRKCGFDDLACRADAHLLGQFSYGALFAVRQSRLAAVQGERLDLLRRAALGHEAYGYVIERLWLHLFGAEFVLPLPADGPLAGAEERHPDERGLFVPPDRTSKKVRRFKKVARRVGRLAVGR